MSHTYKIKRGNAKLKGVAAEERSKETKEQRKKEKEKRLARKHSHD